MLDYLAKTDTQLNTIEFWLTLVTAFCFCLTLNYYIRYCNRTSSLGDTSNKKGTGFATHKCLAPILLLATTAHINRILDHLNVLECHKTLECSIRLSSETTQRQLRVQSAVVFMSMEVCSPLIGTCCLWISDRLVFFSVGSCNWNKNPHALWRLVFAPHFTWPTSP